MTKFRKKPVVIEAEVIAHLLKWADEAWDSLPDWVIENINNGKLILLPSWVEITTDEGVLRGEKNDYLIKGVKGEIYSCKPDVFEKTYDAVE
jgi:hypothetical protein